MRSLLFVVNIVLLQALGHGLAWSLVWLVRPFVTVKFLPVLIVVLIISNLFLLGLFVGAFRVTLGYLAVLWIGFLSALFSVTMIFLLKKLGLDNAILHRVLAIMSFGGLMGLAVYNAYMPVVRHLTIKLDKPVPAPVRVAVASDLHLGRLVGNRELDNLANIIKSEQADILLMPGDIMDDNTERYDSRHMAAHFAKVVATPPFGTVASLGNHDLYQAGAFDAITHAITDSKAVLLNDDTMVINITKNGKSTRLNLIGRYDDHHAGRLSTKNLVNQIDSNYHTILLDHRPSEIERNVQLPIDLQVSGHTHNGQVFPANFIVQKLNRLGYGYEKINGTHIVVSSGYGFWGIPFRLGSRSEVWIIDIQGK